VTRASSIAAVPSCTEIEGHVFAADVLLTSFAVNPADEYWSQLFEWVRPETIGGEGRQKEDGTTTMLGS
jgi:hypothetical protein